MTTSALHRPIALGCLLALVATGGVADAAARHKAKTPKVPAVCNLITDPAGDTFLVRSQDGQKVYGPQEDALDIVGGDIASNATALTGVYRVKKLATKVGTAPLGTDYRLQFVLPGEAAGENIFLNARTDSSGVPSFIVGTRTIVDPILGESLTAKLADITGVFDLAKNEVRMTVPLSALAGHGNARPGAKIDLNGGGTSPLDQTSARQVAVNPATGVGTATFADVTTTKAIYVAGTPSCVTVGK